MDDILKKLENNNITYEELVYSVIKMQLKYMCTLKDDGERQVEMNNLIRLIECLI